MSFRERLRSSPVCRLVGLPLDLNQVHELSSVLLADVPSLTHLRLEENDIHADGVVALAAALRNSPAGQPTRLHALRTLYISNQPLGDEGAVHLASILQENSVLTWVNFQANQIGAAGATALAEALKSNTTCTQLLVGGNRMGDEGAQAFADMLDINDTLKCLDLSANHIGDKGAEALGMMLRESGGLEKLNLGANRIGDRGAADLGFALLLQRSLKELSLFANRITDVGARKLADALGFNIALTVCELGDPVDGSSAIGADGAAAIEEALKVNIGLKSYVGPGGGTLLPIEQRQANRPPYLLKHNDHTQNDINWHLAEMRRAATEMQDTIQRLFEARRLLQAASRDFDDCVHFPAFVPEAERAFHSERYQLPLHLCDVDHEDNETDWKAAASFEPADSDNSQLTARQSPADTGLFSSTAQVQGSSVPTSAPQQVGSRMETPLVSASPFRLSTASPDLSLSRPFTRNRLSAFTPMAGLVDPSFDNSIAPNFIAEGDEPLSATRAYTAPAIDPSAALSARSQRGDEPRPIRSSRRVATANSTEVHPSERPSRFSVTPAERGSSTEVISADADSEFVLGENRCSTADDIGADFHQNQTWYRTGYTGQPTQDTAEALQAAFGLHSFSHAPAIEEITELSIIEAAADRSLEYLRTKCLLMQQSIELTLPKVFVTDEEVARAEAQYEMLHAVLPPPKERDQSRRQLAKKRYQAAKMGIVLEEESSARSIVPPVVQKTPRAAALPTPNHTHAKTKHSSSALVQFAGTRAVNRTASRIRSLCVGGDYDFSQLRLHDSGEVRFDRRLPRSLLAPVPRVRTQAAVNSIIFAVRVALPADDMCPPSQMSTARTMLTQRSDGMPPLQMTPRLQLTLPPPISTPRDTPRSVRPSARQLSARLVSAAAPGRPVTLLPLALRMDLDLDAVISEEDMIRIEAGLHLTSTRGPLPFHPNIQPTLAYFFDRLQAPPPPVPASVEFSDLASTPSVKSALRSIAPTPVPAATFGFNFAPMPTTPAAAIAAVFAIAPPSPTPSIYSLPPVGFVPARVTAWPTADMRDVDQAVIDRDALCVLQPRAQMTLEQLIKWRAQSGVVFTEAELLHLGLHIAAGLRHLRRHYVVHRDCRPANILLYWSHEDRDVEWQQANVAVRPPTAPVPDFTALSATPIHSQRSTRLTLDLSATVVASSAPPTMPPTPNFRVPWVDVDAEAEKQYRAFVTTRSLESRVLECLPVVSEFSEHLNFSLCPSVMRESMCLPYTPALARLHRIRRSRYLSPEISDLLPVRPIDDEGVELSLLGVELHAEVPESITDDCVDERMLNYSGCDAFALGVCMFQLMHGALEVFPYPVHGSSIQSLDDRELPRRFSTGTRQLVAALLRRDVAQRATLEYAVKAMRRAADGMCTKCGLHH